MGRYYEEQTFSGGIKAAVVARKYGISPSTVTQWVRDYREKHGEHAVR